MSVQLVGGLVLGGLMLLAFLLVRMIVGSRGRPRTTATDSANGPFESPHDWHMRQNMLLHANHHEDRGSGSEFGDVSSDGGSDGGGSGGGD